MVRLDGIKADVVPRTATNFTSLAFACASLAQEWREQVNRDQKRNFMFAKMRKTLPLMTLNAPNNKSNHQVDDTLWSRFHPRERVEIDITAGQNNSDALSRDVDLLLENRGIRHSSGRLDNNLHRFPDCAHGRGNRVFGHGHHVVNVTLDNRKVSFADICSKSI